MVSTITLISTRLASKYTFPNYEQDDIVQEAFIIGMEALDRYDGVRPLENFLSIHIKNRLKNFKRDHYYRPDEGKAEEIQQGKKKLLEAGSIDDMRSFICQKESADTLEERELIEYIDDLLPANMRGDYLRFKNEQTLTKTKRAHLLSELREIVERFYA